MIFIFYLAFAVELVALGVGLGFLIWAYRKEGKGVGLAKVAGFIITIGIAFILLCTFCTGLKYWKHTGYMEQRGGYHSNVLQRNQQLLRTQNTQ